MQKNSAQKETKSEKFERLAELRINNILKELRKLGNLSNTRNYHYTEQHIKQMFSALNRSLRGTKKLFTENSNAKQQQFEFKRIRQ
jgi:hypothetical protein